MEGKPKQDSLLIASLHREKHIPLALIVMVTVLVTSIYQQPQISQLMQSRLDMLYKSMGQGIRWPMHSPQQTLLASKLSDIISISIKFHAVISCRSVTETLLNIQQKAAPYVERLQTDLYQAMMYVFFSDCCLIWGQALPSL